MRRVGEYGVENYKLMEKFKLWLSQNDLFGENSTIMGIALDDAGKTAPSDCRYDVCLVVSENFVLNASEVSIREFDGGKYAVLIVSHTAEGILWAYEKGIELIAREGYKLDFLRPVVERYSKKMVEEGNCELCVPIL